MFQGVDDAHPLTLLVHDGGAVIEVPADTTAHLNLPLGAAAGQTLSSISLKNGGSGYIAPPAVTLAGGGGAGATAIAEIDRDTGKLAAVRVTSGGSGYTSAPSVAFAGGGGTGASATAVVSAPPVDGGLKKTGPGTLCLTATNNTYAGLTEVADGTLILTATNVLPAGSAIRITGGSLRCASTVPPPRIWYDPADAATVTLDGAGNVIRLANKGYSGVMHDAVPDTLAAPHLATGAASHSAHPMVDTVSGTSGLLSLNNTGISGTAPRSLIAVISRNTGRGCAVSQCLNASVPRSAFEILARATDNTRFGTLTTDIDFAGVQTPAVPYVCTFVSAVNGLPTQLATFRDGVDGPVATIAINTADARLGLNTRNGAAVGTYAGQIGEVMLFDASLTADQRMAVESYLLAKWKNGMNVAFQDFVTAIDPLPGRTIDLAGGTLDLAGQVASSLTVTGSGGSVSNGTLAAGTLLSPGGDDAVGTLVLSDVGVDGAEYRLSFDGAQADLITSEGALDLTGLTVTALAEPSGRIYTILHAAGGLAGEKPQLVGLPSKWRLISTENDVCLAKRVGTCLTVY
jgi:autotransporter-associated beta strand protein